MTPTAPNSSSPAPRRGGRADGSRTVRAALAAGLAAGSAFAAATGISLATTTTATTSSRSQTTTGSGTSTSAPTPPAPGKRGRGPARGPGGLPGRGGAPNVLGAPGALRGPRPGGAGLGGPGGLGGPASGTITAINGSTLTLRTENGTETVDTSSSTTYRREQQTIHLSDLRTGEIVSVAPVPPSRSSRSSSATKPPQPGTGTVTAAAVNVVTPTFTGRVISVSNGTYRLVGPGGQLLTVTTTSATRYENGSGSKTSASAIASGDHVIAEGSRSGLTHLTADVVALMPAPPRPPAARSGTGATGSTSHSRRSSGGSASGSQTSTRRS